MRSLPKIPQKFMIFKINSIARAASLERIILRGQPWNGQTADQIFSQIRLVHAGGHISAVTDFCGIRGKVAELILAENYGDPWPEVMTPAKGQGHISRPMDDPLSQMN